MNLIELIRARVQAQGMHAPQSRAGIARLIEVLHLSWWVAGDFGFHSRNNSSFRRPFTRLLKEGMIRPIIQGTYRLSSIPVFTALLTIGANELLDKELEEILHENPSITKRELGSLLNDSQKQIDARIRKEQKRYSIVFHQDKVWHWSEFQSVFPSVLNETDILELKQEEVTELIIVEILKRYPYLSIDQLSYLLQLDKIELYRPLQNLYKNKEIQRGLTRDDSPDELFYFPLEETEEIDWEKTPTFVLERRDALVEVIKLERYFENKNLEYWIFHEGIPQAEFNMKKQGRTKEYDVEGFSRLSTATLSYNKIIRELQLWAGIRSMKLDINVDDEYAKISRQFIEVLQSRGYTQDGEALTLVKPQIITGTTSRKPKVAYSRKYSWKTLGLWYRQKQFIGSLDTTPDEILNHLVQIDEGVSISLRTGVNPNSLQGVNIVYTTGLSHRFGFVHKNYIQDILLSFPRSTNLRILDKKIVDILDKPKNILQISEELGRLEAEIKNRVLSLERNNAAKRNIEAVGDTNNALWTKFSTGLPKLRKGDGRRSDSSLSIIVKHLLRSHIPLTVLQISQIIGIPSGELQEIRSEELRKGNIIEGYYIEEENEPQMTLPDIMDELEKIEQMESEENSAWSNIDIVPFSDQVAIVYSRSLLENFPDLQPTQRYHQDSEWWLILWKGAPAGYLVKSPTDYYLADYGISIKLRDDMMTNPVISGILQEVVNVFKRWFDDELVIEDVNNMKLTEDRFESIHFLLATVGVQYL